MFKTPIYRLSELFVLFVLIPIALTLNWSIRGKIALGVLGFVYVVVITFFAERVSYSKPSKQQWRRFFKTTILKFLSIALALAVYVYVIMPEKLFYVIIKDPKVWLFFIGVYTFFSVIPQEFLYRTFFFKRYQELVDNSNLFILLNAGLFSLGHLFFGNTLVILISFIGGLLFAYTYNKYKSLILVMIEHMLYGCWLYTVGMGEMLGFPS